MNYATLITGLFIATSIAAIPVPAAAADACKVAKFKVTNSHVEGRGIEIRKVKYFNPHAGSTQTEDVKNLVCKFGATCTISGDDLANAKNIDLNSIRVVFRFRERDSDWSDEYQTQPYVPAYRKCTEGKVYGPIVVSDNGNP